MTVSTSLLQKLAAVRAEIGYIQKDGRNTNQGYKFLSELQITELFKEKLERHGIWFCYSSEITNVHNNPKGSMLVTDVRVTYSFIDVETGDSWTGTASGQGADAGDKGVYKAITGAVKYIFMKTFLIPTGDDPEHDDKPRRSSAPKAATAEEEKFLADLEED